MSTTRITLLETLAIAILITGCESASTTRITETGQERPDEHAIVAKAEQPIVIRGLSVDAAMAEVLKQINASNGDARKDEYPLALDTLVDQSNSRTALESYLEQRLIEAMRSAGYVLVPRSDESQERIRLIRESRAGEANLRDRMNYGELRSARALILGNTTHFPSHVELAVHGDDVEKGMRIYQARVELSWDDNLRGLARTQLLTLQQLQLGGLPASGARFAVESEPIWLSYRLLPFMKGPTAKLLPRPTPLVNGGALQSGDGFAIEFQTNRDCYVYAFLHSSDGSAGVLFPHKEIQQSNRVNGGSEYRIPKDLAFHLDDIPGIETIYLVASDEPLSELNEFARLLGPADDGGKKGDLARRLVSRMQGEKQSTWLKNRYVDRPGTKGIRSQLAGVESDATQHSNEQDSRFAERLEGLGCLVKSVRIVHQ